MSRRPPRGHDGLMTSSVDREAIDSNAAVAANQAPIVMLRLPWDANSSYQFGCAAGPDAIRGAMHSGSGNDATEYGVEVVPIIRDVGNIELANVADSADDADAITAAIDAELLAGHRVDALGGDHAVTYPIRRAMAKHHERLTVVHIDAHPDTSVDFEGNRFSHASPFVRALEDGCMERLVQVGIRTANRHAREQAERFGGRMLTVG